MVRTPPAQDAAAGAAGEGGPASPSLHGGPLRERLELGEVGPFGPAPTDVLARALEAAVRSGRDAYLLPGVALALVRRDGTSFCGTYGWDGLPASGAAPVHADTLFAAAQGVARCGVEGAQASRAEAGAGLRAVRLRSGGAASRTRRAVGHEVLLHSAHVQAVPAQLTGPADWCSVQDWAAVLTRRLAASTAAEAGGTRGANWRVNADVPGFAARLAGDPARGVAWALLANAGAGPGLDALAAELTRTVLDYTPAPAANLAPAVGARG